MSNLYDALFNDGGLKVDATETPQDTTMFRPRFSKGPNKKYEAIIRFLPNPEDPKKKSVISKWVVFLKDPRTNQGREVDSPSTIGDNDPMTSMFFAMRNATNNPQAVKLSDDFKRHHRYYSLVQVIENAAEPATVGKILVWSYGDSVHDKIKAEQTPAIQGVEPNKPFDLFAGRLFKVVAVEKGGFNNLDQSGFIDGVQYPVNCMRIPQTVNGVTSYVPATRELAATPEGQQSIVNFLQNNAPSLVQYEYKPWTPEIKQYVDEMIMVHSQILDGKQMVGAQQNAAINAMSLNQNPNPMQPQIALGGMIGQSAPTASTTPQTASLSGILSQPTPSTAPADMNMGGILNAATPSDTMGVGTPSIGGIGGVMMNDSFGSAPQSAPAMGGDMNMGSISGLDMNSLGSIMSSTPQSAPATQSAPQLGGDINVLLGDVMA